jgi:hypothetical protein
MARAQAVAQIAIWEPLFVDIDMKATFAQWEDEYEKARNVDRGINWWLGDILRIGQERWGEAFAAVVDPNFAEQHKNKMWVAGRVPKERRRAALSWSLHREVAAMRDDDMVAWLDKAEAGDNGEPWSVARIREEIKKTRDNQPPADDEPELTLKPEVRPDRDAEITVEPIEELGFGVREEVPQRPVPSVELRKGGSERERSTTEPPMAPIAGHSSDTPEITDLRNLIGDLRTFAERNGKMSEHGEDLIQLEGRILELFDPEEFLEPLRNTDDALSLRRRGWAVALDEDEEGNWRTTLKKEGMQRVFGYSPVRQIAICEALLSAEIIEHTA